MDTGTVMEVRKRKIRTDFALLGSCSLLLSGCIGASREMTEDLAGQVAVDTSGCPADQVQDLSISRTDEGYLVTFSNDSGRYSISVAGDGTVQSYLFQPNEEPEDGDSSEDGQLSDGNSNESGEQKPDNSAETGENSEEANNQGAEQGNENSGSEQSLPEGSLSREELVSRAAQSANLKDMTVSDAEFSEITDNSVTITMRKDGAVYVFKVSPHTGYGTYTVNTE